MSTLIKCPDCGSLESHVKNTRARNDNQVIWRQRVCQICSLRWSTWESDKQQVELRRPTAWERLTDEQRRVLSKIINDFAKANRGTNAPLITYMKSA